MPRSLRLCLLGIALLIACGERRSATAPIAGEPSNAPPAGRSGAPIPAPGPVAAVLDCEGSVASATLTCAPAAAGAMAGVSGALELAGGPLTLGGQGENVLLASSNVHYDPDAARFTFNVTVKNLLGQALGTEDGTTMAAGGVRVFFISITRTGGTGVVWLMPDGYGTFTAALQPYYQYDQVLQPDATSAARLWTLTMLPTVTSFSFRVAVAAMVRYPDGWIDVAPAAPVVGAGTTVTLTPAVWNALGRREAGATVAWSSSDPTMATVSPAGLVTGVAPGNVTITASSTVLGRSATGTASVSVQAPPVANADAYPRTVIGHVPVNSAPLAFTVSGNDVCSGCTITAYDAVSHNGGTVVVDTVGQDYGTFRYLPPVGFRGTGAADSFHYTIRNLSGSATAKVVLPVSAPIWFVDPNVASDGDGRLGTPFKSLASFNAVNDGVAGHAQDGDAIFLYEGGTDNALGVQLRAGQKLIGQGAMVPLARLIGLVGDTVPTGSGALPAMNPGGSTSSTQAVVYLHTDNTVRGLSVGGIWGEDFGTLTAADVAITSHGLHLTRGTFSGSFRSISGTDFGISLYLVSGTVSVTGTGTEPGSGGTISAPWVADADYADISIANMKISGSINTSSSMVSIVNSNINTDMIVVDGDVPSLALRNNDITYRWWGVSIQSRTDICVALVHNRFHGGRDGDIYLGGGNVRVEGPGTGQVLGSDLDALQDLTANPSVVEGNATFSGGAACPAP